MDSLYAALRGESQPLVIYEVVYKVDFSLYQFLA